MNTIQSNKSLEWWVEAFIERLEDQAQADRADDVPAYNRLHTRIVQALEIIKNAGPRGRDSLENLLHHEMPQVRMWAAGCVIEWNPDTAIPVLGRLLIERLPENITPVERTIVRGGASSRLKRFFGITSHERNDLVEPLKGYGIDLPRRPERPWFH